MGTVDRKAHWETVALLFVLQFQTLPLSTLTETVEDLLDGEAFLEALKVMYVFERRWDAAGLVVTDCFSSDESFFSIVGSPSAGEDKVCVFTVVVVFLSGMRKNEASFFDPESRFEGILF